LEEHNQAKAKYLNNWLDLWVIQDL
jgi:hypothetical protein